MMNKRKITTEKKRLLFCALLLSFSFFSLYSQDYVSSFHKGSVNEKIEAIKEATKKNDVSLLVSSLDFCISAHDSLGEDEDFVSLTETTIKSLQSVDSSGKEKIISEKLRTLFKTFNDPSVKKDVISSFSLFPSPENILIVNDFFYSALQSHSETTDTLLNAVIFMGKNGNSSSFNMMFVADILDIFPDISDILASSYGSLAEGSEKEIAQFLSSVPVEMKIKIISRLSENDQIPKRICGKASENALSSVIYNFEGARKEVSPSEVSLILACLKSFNDAKWTKASSLIPQTFSLLSGEYEKENISDKEFSDVIKDISFAGTKETALSLSSYLDSLNKKCEKGDEISEEVLLSLIEALGRMGDKVSFDSLFYVTYLDYPETVIEASKEALANLKW